MKGLLIKDFSLVKAQKNFFIFIIVIATVFLFAMKDADFVLVYMGIVLPMFALSTISYDEFDNGNAFLFSLPISRREYVIEKYVFGILLIVCSMALGTVLLLIASALKAADTGAETFQNLSTYSLLPVLLLSYMIPMQLKFGAEKSRIAMIISGAIIFGVSFVIVKLCTLAGIGTFATAMQLKTHSFAAFAIILFCVEIALLLLSLSISTAIMNKKEF